MPRNLARLSVIAATLAAAVSIAPSAMAAPADDKELCKSGGFANYIDPTTNLPFNNPGRCVSFVNGGGVLVPVQEEPPVPDDSYTPTIELVAPSGPETPDYARIGFTLSGWEPGSVVKLTRSTVAGRSSSRTPIS